LGAVAGEHSVAGAGESFLPFSTTRHHLPMFGGDTIIAVRERIYFWVTRKKVR